MFSNAPGKGLVMRKTSAFLLYIIFILLCLTSCQTINKMSSATSLSSGRSGDPENEEKKKDDIVIIREHMDEDCSYVIKMYYDDLGRKGFEKEITRVMGTDGSFSVDTVKKEWLHGRGNAELEQHTTLYYCYEQGKLYQYNYADDKVLKKALNDGEVRSLKRSHNGFMGGAMLLPYNVEGFSEIEGTGKNGERSFDFSVDGNPLGTSDCLAQYLREIEWAFYDPDEDQYHGYFETDHDYFYDHVDKTHIHGHLTTDNELRPKKITYDLSELEPYYHTKTDSGDRRSTMSLEITYDHDMEKHVKRPPIYP